MSQYQVWRESDGPSMPNQDRLSIDVTRAWFSYAAIAFAAYAAEELLWDGEGPLRVWVREIATDDRRIYVAHLNMRPTFTAVEDGRWPDETY